jgi:hypothetical protein
MRAGGRKAFIVLSLSRSRSSDRVCTNGSDADVRILPRLTPSNFSGRLQQALTRL